MAKIKQVEGVDKEFSKIYEFKDAKENESILNRNFKRVNEEVDAMISEILGLPPRES